MRAPAPRRERRSSARSRLLITLPALFGVLLACGIGALRGHGWGPLAASDGARASATATATAATTARPSATGAGGASASGASAPWEERAPPPIAAADAPGPTEDRAIGDVVLLRGAPASAPDTASAPDAARSPAALDTVSAPASAPSAAAHDSIGRHGGAADSAAHPAAGVASALDAPDPALAEALNDEGLFELAIERIPTRIIVVVQIDDRGQVLIPLRPVVELAGIRLRVAGGSLLLEWPAGFWETEIDPEVGTMRVGAEPTQPLPEGSFQWVDGGLYLAPGLLATVLDATVDVSWADLLIAVGGAPGFPAARRLQLESDRARAARGAAGYGPDSHADVPFLPRTGGASATWGVSLFESDGQTSGNGRFSAGGSVLGGAAEVGGVFGFGSGGQGGTEDLVARFSRQVHGTEWLRRVELGSVLSGGTIARRMVGGTLTNEPYTQPRYFGDASIMPAVPAGWEYEVYQGGNLVGFSGADSREEIKAPLNYGNTPVTVRLIGPAGQEVTEDLLYVVNPRQVPAGSLRYDVGAGACRDARCESYGYGEVRYGVLPWLTLGGGADRLAPDDGADADVRVVGSAVVRPLSNLTADVQLQPGAFLQGGARLLTSATGNLAATYTWNRPRESGMAFSGWQGQLSGSTLLPLPGGRRTVTGRLFLRGQARDEVASWRASVAAPLGRSFVMADYEAGLQMERMFTLRTFTPLPIRRSWLRDLAVHASVSANRHRAELFEAGASFRPVPWGSTQAGLRLRHGSPPQVTLGFVTRSRAGFAQSRAIAGERSSLSLSMDGGVALQEGPAELMILPSQGIGQSGVHGVVFHDLNGDGIRDPDEPAAAGVSVSVQGRRAETDAEGRYRLWEIQPYDAVVVGVDSLTLDFGWTPSPRQVVVRPSPNIFNRVDLPVVRTREVTGSVEGPARRALAGVSVEVVDADGAIVVTGRTFSDGEFYFQSVPPGTFLVRVADSSARALGLCGTGVEVTLSADGDEVLGVPTLRLRPEC
jgi:hypothetical protein